MFGFVELLISFASDFVQSINDFLKLKISNDLDLQNITIQFYNSDISLYNYIALMLSLFLIILLIYFTIKFIIFLFRFLGGLL